jgi:hypothetical protein
VCEIHVLVSGGHLEHGDLLDERLQSGGVRSVSRYAFARNFGCLDALLLLLTHLVQPNLDKLLELACCEVTQQGVLSELL